MKYIITESQLDKIYDSYLNHLFKGLHEVSSKEFPYRRFWKIGDEVVLEFEKKGTIWIKVRIWDSFSNMFGEDDDETQQVMKEWLEKHLNLEGIKPIPSFNPYNPLWETI